MSKKWRRILEVMPTGKTVFRLADAGEERSGSITIPYTGWKFLSKIDGFHEVQAIAESLRLPYAYTER